MNPRPFATATRSSSLYSTPRWKQERKRFLNLHSLCIYCRQKGIAAHATFVDHKKPHRGDDVMFWDQSNWQPLCRHCSNVKTGQETRSRIQPRSRPKEAHPGLLLPDEIVEERPMFATPTTVVCGPPGAGKTSYVRQHAQPGDLILDVDALYMALSGQPMYDKPAELLPFVIEARDAVIERLRQRSRANHAWVITLAPTESERQPYAEDGADVVVLATPAEDCLARITADPERARWDGWTQLVESWWTSYDGQ